MTHWRRTVLLILCLAAAPLVGATDDWLPTGVQESIRRRVDAGINVSIAVGQVDRDGTHVFSYGTKVVGGTEFVDEHSIYEIGSITKTFTCTLFADMVLKGELELDDAIEQYLPSGQAAPTRGGQSIRLVHLATHTSGLPRMPDNFAPADSLNPYADYSVEQLYAFLASYELTRDIGERYLYSNVGMGLLGHLLGLRAEKSFDALVEERILTELGMSATGPTVPPERRDRLARGHHQGRPVPNWDLPTLAGAGVLKSSVTDMLRYLAANLGLLESSLYPAMQMTHQARPETKVMGLGWHFRGDDIVWHNGGTGGYRAFAGFRRDGSKGVVVLTNCTTSVDDIGVHLLDPSRELQPPRPSIVSVIRPVLETQGTEAAIEEYRRLKSAHAREYDFSENQLNALGYELLRQERWDDAIEIFKLNVAAFPDAFNPYDSLGEAYLKKGDKKLAIVNYQRSLELNPDNDNAARVLTELGSAVRKGEH